LSQWRDLPLKPPSEDVGKPDVVEWNSFVRAVLEVTILGYQWMRQKSIARLKWEEDHFTTNLEDCMRPFAYKIGVTVVSQIASYTPKMKAGEESIREAKVLDLRLWGHWENYHQVHFVWECKRVAPKHKGSNTYKDLIPEYISEGMFRFLDEEYAVGLSDAGMLGYVLAGDVPSIVRGINRSMTSSRRERKLDITENLRQADPIGTFTDVYLSCHKRAVSRSLVQIHHMFLKFDFINQ